MKKIKLDKSDWMVIITSILCFQIICCWGIDISVSAMLTGGTLTNGWSEHPPMLIYHLTLYCLIIASILQMIIIVHLSLKGVK